MGVLFHARAAAGGGYYKRVNVGAEKGVYVALGEVAGGVQVADVGVNRAAAGLAGGDLDIAAVAGEYADDGVHLRAVDEGHNAAGEQRHSRLASALGGVDLAFGAKDFGGQFGEGAFHFGEVAGHSVEEAGFSEGGLQAGALVEAHAAD